MRNGLPRVRESRAGSKIAARLELDWNKARCRAGSRFGAGQEQDLRVRRGHGGREAADRGIE